MSLAIQQAIVAVLVLACIAHLVRLGWRTLRGGKGACGSCGSCANTKDETPRTVVTIDALRNSVGRR